MMHLQPEYITVVLKTCSSPFLDNGRPYDGVVFCSTLIDHSAWQAGEGRQTG